MKRSKFTEAQIAFILRQAEDGVAVAEVCRKAGIWLYFRAYCTRWSRSGRSDRPHCLVGWRNRLRRVMFRRGVKPGQWRPFQRAANTAAGGTANRCLVSGRQGHRLEGVHATAPPDSDQPGAPRRWLPPRHATPCRKKRVAGHQTQPRHRTER